MRTTLKTIATATGFSINTVSRVLRNDTRISASTTRIIQSKAEELGYIPDAIASSMRNPRTRTIGVVSADFSNPFFSEVIRGIEERAQEIGYQMLVGNSEENEEKERHLVRLFLSRKVDGFIVMPVFGKDSKHLEFYSSIPVPFIFAGRYIDGLKSHSVLHGDEDGEESVFDYLLKKGHRNILYLSGPDGISNTQDRDSGRQKAYDNNDVRSDQKYVFHLTGHPEDGYQAINTAINKSMEFSANDVEVIGYDNLMFSQFMEPALTTVDVPKHRLGYVAMDILEKHINDPEMKYETNHLSSRLLFRDSTGSDKAKQR